MKYGDVWRDTADGETLMVINEGGIAVVLVPADTSFGLEYPAGSFRFPEIEEDHWERLDDAE